MTAPHSDTGKPVLRGMTWDHPRGWHPLEACAAVWRERTGVEISWDRRSLQDFETYPVETLAREYDLIVIDHPHVGQVARESCLLPLPEDRLADIASGSVGASFSSYCWQGRQWAVPIDAATQVQAWRPDRLDKPAADWSEVLRLARAGHVALPLRAPHSLMCLYTLSAQLGAPACVDGPDLFDSSASVQAIELLSEILPVLDPRCTEQDPIAVLDGMKQVDSRVHCSPLIYGYVSYSLPESEGQRIGFFDIPLLMGRAPAGSALGGTGMAVSALRAHTAQATEFAIWVAGAQAQAGPYAAAGGQPGHAFAWESAAVNLASGNFYRNTRRTLEGAWVRPRHDGYMAFQEAGSHRLLRGLLDCEAPQTIVDDLNRLFRESLKR